MALEAGSLATDQMMTEGRFLSRLTSSHITSLWCSRFSGPMLWELINTVINHIKLCPLSVYVCLSVVCLPLRLSVTLRLSVFLSQSVCLSVSLHTHTHARTHAH